MTEQTEKPGPMISMTRAEELAQTTGRPYIWRVHYLEAQAEGKGVAEAVRAVCERNETPSLSAAHIMTEISRADRVLSERDAENDGLLWTIAGGLGLNKVAFLIVQGRGSATLDAMVNAEMPSCYGVVQSTTIGTKKDAAKADEYTIRFL